MTDGERWTREQLELLRGRGFSAAAIGRFLAASSHRAGVIREERPELARRARGWIGLGAAAWIVPAAAGVEPFRRRLGSGLGWWAATAAMLDWHLGMFETAGGRPRQLGPADALTLTRAWLVPVAWASPTGYVIGLGAATDALDGPVARTGQPTRAGRDLEGLVDTCFSLAALRGLVGNGRLGRGPALAESMRLIGGASFATFSYFGRAHPPESELLRSARSSSVLRFAGVIAAASGRRHLGDVLVLSGALGSLALTAAKASDWRISAPRAPFAANGEANRTSSAAVRAI